MVKVFPQNLSIAFNGEGSFPNPQGEVGLPLYDTSIKVLKFSDSAPGVFYPALPEHTLTGQHGPKVTITQTSADNALAITQVGNASGINVVCGVGGGRGLSITQAAAQDGIIVDKSNTSAGAGITVLQRGTDPGIAIGNSGASHGLSIVNAGGTASRGINVVQNGSIHGIEVTCNNVGATNSMGLAVNQMAASEGIRINQSGNATALAIENTTQSGSIRIRSTTTPSVAAAITIDHRGIGGGGGGMGMRVNQYGDAQALYITKTGTGVTDCVDIINSSGGCALNINTTSSGTGAPGLQILQYGNANALSIWQYGAGGGLRVEKLGTDGSDAAYIVNNAGTGDALEVWQYKAGVGIHVQKSNTGAGDAILVTNSGSSACLAVYHNRASATVPAIYISNNATASNGKYDIWGNSGNWWVDRSGNASFANVANKIASGYISGAYTSFSVNFSTGTVSPAGTYIGNTGFTSAPHVMISNSDTGTHANTDHHRMSWTYTVTATTLTVTISYHDINPTPGFRFMWLAIGK